MGTMEDSGVVIVALGAINVRRRMSVRLTSVILMISLLFTGGISLAETIEDSTVRLDELFFLLKEADPEDFLEIEQDIVDIWTDSGSAAMNLLLERGRLAMVAQDYPKAIEHLSALIDHAPEFAAGWNARATVYYFTDEYALAISDLRQTLILNPRHFGALNGLGLILEDLGHLEAAYKAYLMAQELHPYLDTVNEAIRALRQDIDGTAL